MEQKKNLKFDELTGSFVFDVEYDKNFERVRLIQALVNCDNMISRFFDEPYLQKEWIDKKTDLQFELEQLNPDEL